MPLALNAVAAIIFPDESQRCRHAVTSTHVKKRNPCGLRFFYRAFLDAFYGVAVGAGEALGEPDALGDDVALGDGVTIGESVGQLAGEGEGEAPPPPVTAPIGASIDTSSWPFCVTVRSMRAAVERYGNVSGPVNAVVLYSNCGEESESLTFSSNFKP